MLKTNDYFIKHTLRKYLVTTILCLLGTTVVVFINTLLVGNTLGQQALAAMNLVQPLSFVYAMLGCLIGIGGATLVAVAIGREENRKIGSLTSTACLLAVVLPICVSILGVVFFHPMMNALGAKGTFYTITRQYAMLLLISGVFTTFMYFPFNFLRADGRMAESMLMFLILGIADVGLAILFLSMGLGLTGIGLAVLISSALADLVGIVQMAIGSRQIFFGRIQSFRQECLQITKTGSSAALNNLCNLFRTTCMNGLLLTYLGENGVSVFAVVCAVLNFATAFVAGSGQSISPLVGVFDGEKDNTSIRTVLRQAIRYSVLTQSLLLLAAAVFSRYLAIWFGITGKQLVAQTSAALVWMMASLVLGAVNNIFIFYYMTIKQTILASLLTFLRAFGFVVLSAALLLKGGAGQWVWSCFVLAESGTFAIMLLLTKIYGVRHPQEKGILLLDEEADRDDSYLSFSVEGNEEGAVQASSIMEEFCNSHQMKAGISTMLPLALEELLVLIAKYSLLEDEQKYSDVRILVRREDVILRIRCGGKIFDPLEYYHKMTKTLSKEELLEADTLGIQMIDGVAKQVMFKRTFGVNNLTIIL